MLAALLGLLKKSQAVKLTHVSRYAPMNSQAFSTAWLESTANQRKRELKDKLLSLQGMN